ncbi:tRNA (N6-isopentenyl adenosine(37)-C2)-methylthiotransferase MiaB [Thermoanaerobacterium sp. RBIITD]|uniref:tRNA (N6-isopentenyl adenosine(37)-C2)-methylthiotransferase MiaB n=1 Tax=Thermoanaerobacterium sp. RBIITD TaxID=1550240 RepID=UPI000BB960E5|nr:tRNA (N6-isopentenyl adenosine(37)-C2)-methylthiotransferase MiaB [Thermoanaerobacterium sp. RBIITD]SNX55431.1 tRNA-2-methylthio-N6-dimethylallyladenosine synthase [Thermoanaerobacterium sp. RBIITD]
MGTRKEVLVSKEDIKKQKEIICRIADLNKDRCPKFYIETYGCQMNVHDSEKLAGMLSDMGYINTDNIEDADVILFNTCCVREHAEIRVFGRVSQLKELKLRRPNITLGICGCMMQEKEIVEKIKKNYPYVDIVFGTHNLFKFPELLLESLNSDTTIIDIWDDNKNIVEDIPIQRAEGLKAWVNIIYGCNNFCTYCIVPYVRGREKSRKPEDILDEVKSLAKEGFKEITLLGQNVNSYGNDLSEKVDFADLLYMLNDVDGIKRIRFMTSHPKDISDKLIYAMKDLDKVCEHLHLPVQSGSNRILKKMNRKYTKERYLEIVDKLRENVPECAITTDIIVGFPGETEEDFEETLDLVKRVRYDAAYTFIYSKRTGTPAAKMENQVEENVKHERLERLINLQNSISLERNSEMNGKIVEVLVEGKSKRDSDKLTGRTRTNKIVHFKAKPELIGKFADVKITDTKAWTMQGELL